MHARDYQPGEQVPGTVYQVVRLVGAGGMGTVYDVEDTTIGKRYVLKTLHPQLGAREDLARRMQNEARTLARLNHPNIVEVFTAGVTGDDLRLPYYVMERLNGQSLRVVLEKKKQLERQHAYHIGIDLLDALDHAHDKGVIHRDVKPDNIFLHRAPSGVTLTKLLDFGIVSVLDSGTRETAGRFLGTLRYAAPEQLRGEKPTPKTDVYSAGLVLYEVLAGRGPFDDEGDPHRIGGAHLNKLAPPLSRFVAVPRELEALLMAALAKDPALRPRDAFSFAASLRNLKRNQHGSAPPEVATIDDGATVPSSLGATTTRASRVELLPHSPEGPHVVTTASSTATPISFPNTTVAELAAPTAGQSAVTSSVTATEATANPPADPRWIDRAAATRSHAPLAARSSAGGTAAMMAVQAPVTPAKGPGLVPVPTPDAFPDRSAFFSEGPQVRSLHATAVSRRAWPTLAAGVFGVAALLSLGALVIVLRSASGAHPNRTTLAAAGLSSPPPSAAPVLVLPAPTLDMGALDAPPPSAVPSVETAKLPALAPSDPPLASLHPASFHSNVSSISALSANAPLAMAPPPSPAIVPSSPPPASSGKPVPARPSPPHAAVPAVSTRPAAAVSAHALLDRPGPGF